MNIGIVGCGCVGGAVRYGMEKIGHRVAVHDIQMDTSLEDVLDTTICYICVPTPATEEGKCDTTIVEKVISDLQDLRYGGQIAIKSTVEPGTTERLNRMYGNVCFVPEFLRERCAISDFVENHDVCIVGTEDAEVYELIKESHGNLPQQFFKLSPTEAELTKYFNNVYNATLITFANSFYELCSSLGADYTKIKDVVVNREHIEDIYLDCNDSFRGFGGMCLPKDTNALAYLCKQMANGVEFFEFLIKENAKYKVTVFDGMRLK